MTHRISQLAAFASTRGSLGSQLLLLCTLVVMATAGCSGRPSRIEHAAIDPSGTAAAAMQAYDTNGDGMIAGEELKACPELSHPLVMPSIDSNQDQQISAEEIEARLTDLQKGGARVSTQCRVLVNGQPLGNATIKLVPPEYLASALPTSQGTTDERGQASIIEPEAEDGTDLPPFAGFYKAEVTHPEFPIPAKYNTQTTLGLEVTGYMQPDTTPEFNLTP